MFVTKLIVCPGESRSITGISRKKPPLVSDGSETGWGFPNLDKSPDFGPFALAKNTKIFRPPSAARCAQNKGGRGERGEEFH